MTELSRKVLESWQVRKTFAQKTAFIDFLRSQGVDLVVDSDRKGKCRNLVVGDLEKAQYILAAHYDTPAVMPVPNFLAPKNFLLTLGYSLLLTVPMLLLMVVVELLLMQVIPNVLVVLGVLYLLLFGFLYLMMAGPANRHNANDNTSGVITLLEAMQDPAIREKAAFVFFDLEEMGLVGSRQFAKRHKELVKSKVLLNFDCVGDGDHFLLITSKDAAEEMDPKLAAAFTPLGSKNAQVCAAKKVRYPSDQANFKRGVGIASFRKHKRIGYYVNRIHTPKDTILEEENISFLLQGLKKLMS